MMASMAEQRRFLQNISKVSMHRLNEIAEDLMQIIQAGSATPTDIEFHKQVCIEISYRMQTDVGKT